MWRLNSWVLSIARVTGQSSNFDITKSRFFYLPRRWDLAKSKEWVWVRSLIAVYTHLIMFGHGRCASRKHVSVHKKASVQWGNGAQNSLNWSEIDGFGAQFALLWSLKSSPKGLFSDWFALLWSLKSSPNRLFSGLMLGLMLTSLCSKSRCKVDSKLFLISDIYSIWSVPWQLDDHFHSLMSRYLKSKII